MAVLKAGVDGKAPAGAKVGDSVQTNGGTYIITGYNDDGSYQSRKQEEKDYGGGYDELLANTSKDKKKNNVRGQVGYITYAPNVTLRDAHGKEYNTGETGMTTKKGSGIYADGDGRLYTQGKSGGWEEFTYPSVSSLYPKEDSLLSAAQSWQQQKGGQTGTDPFASKYDINDYDAAYSQIAQDREAARQAYAAATRLPSGNVNNFEAALNGQYGAGAQAAAENYARQMLDEEQYRKAYYSNLARRFNESGYSGNYDQDADYQGKINAAVTQRNLGDAAIYEVLRNQKLRELGRAGEQTYNYADWLSTGKTGNSNILTDSHGRLLGTLDYGAFTGTAGSPILDVPIIYSELYGPNRTYGYNLDQILANLDAAGQSGAASYLRNAIAEGNTAKVQAVMEQIGQYNSVGGLDAAYAEYLATGRHTDMSNPSWYSNFGTDTANVDSASANAKAVIRGLEAQGIQGDAGMYLSLLDAMNTSKANGEAYSASGRGNSLGSSGLGAAAGGNDLSGGQNMGDDFWSNLISQTEAGYENMGSSLRDAISAQTQQTVNEYERQKETIGGEYEDLYRQLYLDRRQGERRLPQMLAAQGQSGGMTESAALQLQNQYALALAKGEKERIRQISDLDSAISDAKLSGTIAAAQSDAQVQQAALSAYQNLMSSMRSEQLTLEQMEQSRQQWQAEFELSRQQWEREYAMAEAQYKQTVAAQAKADLQAKADNLATYGDFSGYKELGYTDAQVQAMYQAWAMMVMDSGSGGGSSERSRSVEYISPDPASASTSGSDIAAAYAAMDSIRDRYYDKASEGYAAQQILKELNVGSDIPYSVFKNWQSSRGIDLNNSKVSSSLVGR